MSWTRKSLCYTLFQSSPFLESSQWSLSEILGRCPTECAHNSPTRLPTARQAQETAVPCGMSTHGRWAGPARRSLLFCPSEHTDTGQVRAPTPPGKTARRRQNHLLNQQKSEMRPVLGLIGSGSEHIDSSIRAQLPHSTGYMVWFRIDKKLVDHAFYIVRINHWDDGHHCVKVAKISLHFFVECFRARESLRDLGCGASGCSQDTMPSTLLQLSTLRPSRESSAFLIRLGSFLGSQAWRQSPRLLPKVCSGSHRQKKQIMVSQGTTCAEFIHPEYVLCSTAGNHPRPRERMPAGHCPRPRRMTP